MKTFLRNNRLDLLLIASLVALCLYLLTLPPIRLPA